jgi:hypothetical protein
MYVDVFMHGTHKLDKRDKKRGEEGKAHAFERNA